MEGRANRMWLLPQDTERLQGKGRSQGKCQGSGLSSQVNDAAIHQDGRQRRLAGSGAGGKWSVQREDSSVLSC